MTSERWEKIKTLFDEAASLSEGRRAAFLDSTCGADTDLRTSVESMLSADALTERFLEPPAQQSAHEQRVGNHLGPYRIVKLVGRGGMGDVFEAERDDGQFVKRVALKIARPGAWSSELASRFQTERQTLAQLEHPNIARLLDGGSSTEGDPFLVMEFVDGIPIHKFCDQKNLTIRERLELFLTVCAAVQYAHQNFVVHRDLKPGNILVTVDGTVKLLDFGVAKLLDAANEAQPAEASGQSLRFTTPEYASPEQIRGEAVTTASDVYSLGVLLYLLLTGFRPYYFKGRFPNEIAKMVLEYEPEKASERVLQENGQGDGQRKQPDIPLLRNTTRGKLHRQLHGDIDAIVAKALAKDPPQRYSSAEQLAEDIRRYLSDSPLLARRGSFSYRAAKFMKRHKASALATALVVLSVAAGFVGVIWEGQHAKKEAAKANEVNTFLKDMLASADPYKSPKDITVAEIIDQAAERAERQLGAQPEIQASVQHTLGETYLSLGMYDKAATQLDRAYQKAAAVFGDKSAETAKVLHSLAYLAQVNGDYRKADSLYKLAILILRKESPQGSAALASSLNDWGTMYEELTDFDKAAALLSEAVQMYKQTVGTGSAEYAMALSNYGAALGGKHEYAAAETVYRQALDLRIKSLGPDHLDVANTLNNLAFLLLRKGNLDSVESLFRRSLAIRRLHLNPVHPEMGLAMMNLAGVLLKKGKLDEADTLARQAVDVDEKTLAEDNPQLASALYVLGRILLAEHHPSEADIVIRRALSFRQRSLPPGHHNLVVMEVDLARALAQQHRYAEAETLLKKTLQESTAENKPDDSALKEARQCLDEVYLAWQKK